MPMTLPIPFTFATLPLDAGWSPAIRLEGPMIIQMTFKETFSLGEQIFILTNFENNLDQERPFVGYFEVRDPMNVTVYIGWQSGNLEALGREAMGLSWLAEGATGRNQARSVAVAGFETPHVLSGVKVTYFDVE
jgi:hypothetical protein